MVELSSLLGSLERVRLVVGADDIRVWGEDLLGFFLVKSLFVFSSYQ